MCNCNYSPIQIEVVENVDNPKIDPNYNSKSNSNWEYITDLQHTLKSLSQYSTYKDRIIITPVTPWGHFTTSLNIATGLANELGFEHICFQSFEFSASVNSALALYRVFRDDQFTLVAGAALPGYLHLILLLAFFRVYLLKYF